MNFKWVLALWIVALFWALHGLTMGWICWDAHTWLWHYLRISHEWKISKTSAFTKILTLFDHFNWYIWLGAPGTVRLFNWLSLTAPKLRDYVQKRWYSLNNEDEGYRAHLKRRIWHVCCYTVQCCIPAQKSGSFSFAICVFIFVDRWVDIMTAVYGCMYSSYSQ